MQIRIAKGHAAGSKTKVPFRDQNWKITSQIGVRPNGNENRQKWNIFHLGIMPTKWPKPSEQIDQICTYAIWPVQKWPDEQCLFI